MELKESGGGARKPRSVSGPPCSDPMCRAVTVFLKHEAGYDVFICPTVYGGCNKTLKVAHDQKSHELNGVQ